MGVDLAVRTMLLLLCTFAVLIKQNNGEGFSVENNYVACLNQTYVDFGYNSNVYNQTLFSQVNAYSQ